MLSDTLVTVGSHTFRLSTVLMMIGVVLLFGIIAFVFGLMRGKRVSVQRSPTTEELNVHLARIAEALERIANQPADQMIAKASEAGRQSAEVEPNPPQARSPFSTFTR
jgi:hypothetical protein